MRNQASIQINRSAADVYAYVTNPNNAAYWQVDVNRYEFIAHSDTGAGTQIRWIFNAGPYQLEVIETIITAEPPHLFASKHMLTRFISGPPAKPGEAGDTADSLAQQFRMAYGQGNPGGLVAVKITPDGADRCILEIRMETEIGGSAGLITRVSRLLGRNALKKSLQHLKSVLDP